MLKRRLGRAGRLKVEPDLTVPGHPEIFAIGTYLHAHLALKEAALAKLKYEGVKRTRFRPNDRLLAFLEAL